MHLQLPPIFLDHDHNLLHHLYKRGERVKGREGRRVCGDKGDDPPLHVYKGVQKALVVEEDGGVVPTSPFC